MSGSAINHKAYEVYTKVKIMILKWKQENHGKMPKYLFLSGKAYFLLALNEEPNIFHYTELKTFMGVEIASVGVPGIYASIGDEFD